MQWPPWSSKPSASDQVNSRQPAPLEDPPDKTGWRDYVESQNLISTLILTTTTLVLIHVYRNYLRRIPQVDNIQPGFFRRRSLFGRVTSVGDGDNFRLFHTPGGRLAGWGWFPGRRVPERREDLKSRTIHVRLAGVDAPELAHFGRPAQPYSGDALTWLREYILQRRVRAYIYKRDQYDRVVATVYVRRWLIRRDVGLQMLKQGLATVYEAKSGAEFGSLEHKYRRAEWWAKKRGKGMWAMNTADFESPRAYKTRMNSEDRAK
ncbi:putative endonuclease lcl3 [Glutinoglossum americanum]|uniref:Probable endonuclease LCL3 n=1 Tax=Glutinoglossum americanum TaxID=1670608 RepID=A0A9P8ID61_9PEZI|nr:putative endonuclease lcl3 [Glutinoglossum americanum]